MLMFDRMTSGADETQTAEGSGSRGMFEPLGEFDDTGFTFEPLIDTDGSADAFGFGFDAGF